MRILSLKQLEPYGVAALSVGLATAPLLGESAPLLLFAIAVILTSWFGGVWPGLLMIILSLLVIDYFFFAPKSSILRYDSRLDQIRAVSFGIFWELPSLIFAQLRESIKAKKKSRERFRLLVEGVKDYAIFMLDAQGRVASWNHGAERIKGYQLNEIIGRDYSVFYTPEDIESGEPQRVLEIVATEGRYDVSGWQVRRDGSRFWASGVIAAAHDDRGRLRGFTVITRDVTKRKLSEQKFLFLANLDQALRPLSDPGEIMAATARIVGEYLGADRCAYAEVEAAEKYLEITSEYPRGEIPSFVGRFSVYDLGAEALRLMRANRPYLVNNIEAEASARIDLSRYLQAGVRALMCAPLSKNGRYVARMAVSQKTPRRWETWEIEFVKKAADRCWESVERARAARNLRESEERYRAFIANSAEAIWRFELEQPIPVNLPEHEQIDMLYRFGYIAECNDAMARMYGYKTADQIVGARIGDLLPRPDQWNISHIHSFRRSGFKLMDSESQEVDRYGNTKYFLKNMIGIVENGAVVRTWGTQRDITERMRAEESLCESEERFSKAFRASPYGLAITRQSDGVILEVNDSWLKLFDYESDEVIGKSWTHFGFAVDPADSRRARAIVEKEGYLRDFEMAANRKSGERIVIRLSIEPIELRGERCMVTIVNDITQRKRAEEALRESEEQARRQLAHLEAIYATAPVGLCFVDTNMSFLSINERLAEINGRSVEEHLGRTVREVLPEVADTVEPVFRRVIETGEPALNVEQSAVTDAQPGVTRHFITSFYPIKNGDGRALGVNVVVMDISQRKKIEKELEHLLCEEKAAREEAEAANRMKDEFLATISHELRTPLTSILGWARMLTGGGLTTAQARHALGVIAQSAQSQTQLIEDILDTSRIISGRFKLDAHPAAIEHVFHSAVDVIRPSAEAKGIVLSEVVEASDGVILGDVARLRQAVWNLLSNAVKFTNKGGRIEARLARAKGQIEITIKDTGIGIDPKFLPHVFDRFRQADASSTREYGGLGIGLAIVRHIVEMHGGGVLASSPGKGQGATFKISLPLISASRLERPEGPRVEAPPPTKEREILESSGRLDGVRVLLVEDNLDTLDMLKFIFEEAGAEVITATSVDDALEALERVWPDALISDIAMPNRDGYDLIREVRSREPERGGKIPAVAVTAYTRAEDRMRILAAGFQMHIAKPIASGELIAVVASLTGRIDYGSIGVSGMSASSGH